MSTSPLRIEILIAGLFYFIAVFFFSLKFFGVHDLSFLLQLKDFATLILIIMIAFSYVLGIMAHRLIPLITQPLRFIQRRLKLGKPFKYYNEDEDHVYEKIVDTWQYATERIHHGLNYHFSLLVFFRLLVLGSILLGSSIAYWLIDTKYSSLSPSILLFSFLFSLGCYIAFRKQRSVFSILERKTFDQIKRIMKTQSKSRKK